MNLEAFLWVAGPIDLVNAAPGTPFKIGGKDRAAIEFAMQKEIVAGTWQPGNTFVFAGFGKGGQELLRLLFSDPALRTAAEKQYPTRTQFHVKSALRFAQGWTAPASS